MASSIELYVIVSPFQQSQSPPPLPPPPTPPHQRHSRVMRLDERCWLSSSHTPMCDASYDHWRRRSISRSFDSYAKSCTMIEYDPSLSVYSHDWLNLTGKMIPSHQYHQYCRRMNSPHSYLQSVIGQLQPLWPRHLQRAHLHLPLSINNRPTVSAHSLGLVKCVSNIGNFMTSRQHHHRHHHLFTTLLS